METDGSATASVREDQQVICWGADDFDALGDLEKEGLHFQLLVRPFFKDLAMNFVDHVVAQDRDVRKLQGFVECLCCFSVRKECDEMMMLVSIMMRIRLIPLCGIV